MDPALQKLMAALQEYLAQGGDTPVAPEAQALMDAIQTMGDPAGQDPTAPNDPMDPGGALPTAHDPYQPDSGAPPPSLADAGAMPPPQNAKTFEGARAGAKDRLNKLKQKSKA